MKKFTAAPRVNFLGLLTRERDNQQLMKPSLSIRRALSMLDQDCYSVLYWHSPLNSSHEPRSYGVTTAIGGLR